MVKVRTTFLMTVVMVLTVSLKMTEGGRDKRALCRLERLNSTLIIHKTGTDNTATMFMGVITNLGPGKHGFHVHENGDLSNNCKAAGGHYNPRNVAHGGLKAAVRHEGDFGNILAESNGVSKVSVTSQNTDLDQLIGKALVVHSAEDDLGQGGQPDSLTTGNAGSRLDCCIIEWEEMPSKAHRMGVGVAV